MKDVMAKESNSNLKGAEELNKKMADAADALGDIHKKLMEVFFGEKPGDKNNVVPFIKREKRIQY